MRRQQEQVTPYLVLFAGRELAVCVADWVAAAARKEIWMQMGSVTMRELVGVLEAIKEGVRDLQRALSEQDESETGEEDEMDFWGSGA